MSKLVKKDGKLLKKNGKFVTTDNVANCSCCGDGPCPPGKFCTWIPPDPCSTGKCQPSLISDTPPIPSQCGDAPYDCTSEEACNQWYAANPNPPCDCWFCEDGTWVNKPSLNCINEGGILGQKPPDGDCLPPPGLWCCDGGTEGYFCGERVNVPGIGEMIGEAPIGICNSVTKVDDCSECGPPPQPECNDDGECGTWYIDIYDGTGDHPECNDESLYPTGGPFPTVSAAQAWGQANTPSICYSTMNGFPNPDLACRDGKCVPADNPLP
jgi:hypothetical protein